MSDENKRDFLKSFWNSVTGETAQNKRDERCDDKHRNLEETKEELEVKTNSNISPATQDEPKNQPEKVVKQKRKKKSEDTKDVENRDNPSSKDKKAKTKPDQSDKLELSAATKKKIAIIDEQLHIIAKKEAAQQKQREADHAANLEEAANLNSARREAIALDEDLSRISKDFSVNAEKQSHSPKEV